MRPLRKYGWKSSVSKASHYRSGLFGPRRAALITALLCLLGARLSAQTQTGSDNPDSLFNDGTAAPQTPASQQPSPETPATGSVRPDDLLRDDKIHFFGSADIYGLFGLGWSQAPVLARPGDNFGVEAGGSLTTNIGFEVRPASELRIRGTLSYYFPSAGPLFSEMFVDYSILNSVFFRIGTFDYTWGNSQFYQFANLPARSLPGWTTTNVPLWEKTNLITSTVTETVPVSAKMNIPFGLNGLTFLARFDLANYGFPNQLAPTPKDAGYGLEYDMVTGPVEWSIAGFWQYLLTPRTFLAMKTTISGFDVSAEMTMAFPVKFTLSGISTTSTAGGGIFVGGGMQRIYPTAVLGLSREWTDAHIKFYLEYAYNGERDPGTSWLADATGPGGHNSAAVVHFSNLGPSGLALNLLWQQNWSDGSALIGPFLEISPVALTTIQVGLPLIFGPNNSEVLNNRLVPGDKRFELLILVKLSASFRQ
jgi:hypothetical protein